MKLSYSSSTPFVPSKLFVLNLFGSGSLRYLMKSLCSTLNFNFFFYLIDRSIELPKTHLNLVRSRDSSYSTYHSGSSSKCFLTTTASKTFPLPSGSKLYSKPLRQAKRSKATPRDLTSLTTHPSPA